MMCKTCYSVGKIFHYRIEHWRDNIYEFFCSNPNHAYTFWAEMTRKGWMRVEMVAPKKMRFEEEAIYSGKGYNYFDGHKEKHISQAHLNDIRSRKVIDGQAVRK